MRYYINYLLNHPFRLIFGAGLNYRHVIGGGLSYISIYGSFGAHNTFLDIIKSPINPKKEEIFQITEEGDLYQKKEENDKNFIHHL